MNIQLQWAALPSFREKMAFHQDGRCPICARPLDRPVLDHSHQKRNKGTGHVRGVICNGCNRLLGLIENNAARCSLPRETLPETLRRAAAYLEAPPSGVLHPSEKPPAPLLKRASWKKLLKACPSAPAYTGRLTKKLARLFAKHGITPEFYASTKNDQPDAQPY